MTAATSTLITEPGVWADMPEDVYHADPVPGGSLSSGGARTLLEPAGPAKFVYWRGKQRNSATFDLGKAVHTEALGAGAGLAVVDADSWRTKAAKEAKEAAYAAGQIPVLTDDYRRVRLMVSALQAHPIAGALLAAEGDAEQSLFWIDQDTGVWCRARHDKAIRDRSGRLLIVDVKTCENADEASVARSSANYGYYQQDAWYTDAAVALGLDDDPGFLFAFVEKQPPHLVHVVQHIAADIDTGRARNRRALQIYAECTQAGTWPGYPTDTITDIALPAWATREDLP
jgi:hypothetical protein